MVCPTNSRFAVYYRAVPNRKGDTPWLTTPRIERVHDAFGCAMARSSTRRCILSWGWIWTASAMCWATGSAMERKAPTSGCHVCCHSSAACVTTARREHGAEKEQYDQGRVWLGSA